MARDDDRDLLIMMLVLTAGAGGFLGLKKLFQGGSQSAGAKVGEVTANVGAEAAQFVGGFVGGFVGQGLKSLYEADVPVPGGSQSPKEIVDSAKAAAAVLSPSVLVPALADAPVPGGGTLGQLGQGATAIASGISAWFKPGGGIIPAQMGKAVDTSSGGHVYRIAPITAQESGFIGPLPLGRSQEQLQLMAPTLVHTLGMESIREY